MKKNKIFIHIGYPKTATSWLQRCVFPNIEGVEYFDYLDINNLWYKEIIRPHCLIYQAKDFISLFDPVFSRLKHGNVILSWESLVGDLFSGGENFCQILNRLHDYFPDAIILITIRNQVSLIESVYRQYVHQGGSLTLNQFLKLDRASPIRISKDHFKFDRVVTKYQEEFGKDRVYVLAYEQLHNSRAEFIDGLLEVLEVNDVSSDILNKCNKKQNVGLSDPSLHMMRLLNKIANSDFNHGAILPKHFLNAKQIRYFLQKIIDPLFFNRLNKSSILSEEQVFHLEAYYRDSNKRLAYITGLPLKEYKYPM